MIVLILCLFAGANSLLAQKTLIHCGKLVDVKTGAVLNEMTITVEGKKIIAVDKGFL